MSLERRLQGVEAAAGLGELPKFEVFIVALRETPDNPMCEAMKPHVERILKARADFLEREARRQGEPSADDLYDGMHLPPSSESDAMGRPSPVVEVPPSSSVEPAPTNPLPEVPASPPATGDASPVEQQSPIAEELPRWNYDPDKLSYLERVMRFEVTPPSVFDQRPWDQR